MTINEKKKIAFRMTSRAATGLSFIEDFLSLYNKTDTAYLRSFYILLSYNFELILKSRIVMLSNASDINKLDDELKNYSHSFLKISQKLGNDELRKIGIKSIALDKVHSNYFIKTTNDKRISIEDFNDIRYDFINGKLRVVAYGEYEKIKSYVDTLGKILTKVKESSNNNI